MKNKFIKPFLISLVAVSTLWIVWLSLTPLVDRDATRFHLPFAKLWAENSFLYFRRYYAYYDLNMLNLDYLYMLVFKFGLSDQFTKIIHASFLLAGGYLIFKYFKDKYGFNWGASAFVFYVTVPIHQRLSSEVYVDLGLLFFSTLSIIYLTKWIECKFEKQKYLIISAVGAGLSFGTKYNGMIIAFFITLFVGLIIARENKDDKFALKSMLIFGTVILLFVSPWLIRNFINSGNPFFPLFNSIIPSGIKMPSELAVDFDPETSNRIINGGDNIFSLFMLPLRVFFEGTDHDFLKFDGTLNPFLVLLLPFLFFPKIDDKQTRKTSSYLFTLFIIVYLVTLYSNNIRARYFIPVLPILILLNIEALKNILNSKRISVLFFFFFSAYLLYNINYSVFLSKNLHLTDYNPFSSNSKERYLKKYMINYEIFEFVNKNTPENSIIYEAFTGGRSYYINRVFYSDTTSLDRFLLRLALKGAKKEDYITYFKNLPNSNLTASHILISPNDFINTFIEMNKNENDPQNNECKNKVRGFVEFVNGLKILITENDVYLFKIE